jgi:hypothetical protein
MPPTLIRLRIISVLYFTASVVYWSVSGYRSRGPRFDVRPYQIFSEAGGLERGPLSLVRAIEELFE